MNLKKIGLMVSCAPDFQHNGQLTILSQQQKRYCFNISKDNLIKMSIYFSVRHCIDADWLNDRDQFLYPKDGWQNDIEFQSDCLAFTLFHGQNRISSIKNEKLRIKNDSKTLNSSFLTLNCWLPFTEQEVDAKDKFASNFMTNFIKDFQQGNIGHCEQGTSEANSTLFDSEIGTATPHNDKEKMQFSEEAKNVFDIGRELWKYYHSQENVNPNASLYDIREHFQGRNSKGRMNSKSEDETYTELIGNLRNALKELALKIKPKVYKYEFLKN